jgi:predicted alpha/beta hydrolase
LHWGRWLRLEYCIFDGHHHMLEWHYLYVALEIPLMITDLDTNWWVSPPMS